MAVRCVDRLNSSPQGRGGGAHAGGAGGPRPPALRVAPRRFAIFKVHKSSPPRIISKWGKRLARDFPNLLIIFGGRGRAWRCPGLEKGAQIKARDRPHRAPVRFHYPVKYVMPEITEPPKQYKKWNVSGVCSETGQKLFSQACQEIVLSWNYLQC